MLTVHNVRVLCARVCVPQARRSWGGWRRTTGTLEARTHCTGSQIYLKTPLYVAIPLCSLLTVPLCESPCTRRGDGNEGPTGWRSSAPYYKCGVHPDAGYTGTGRNQSYSGTTVGPVRLAIRAVDGLGGCSCVGSTNLHFPLCRRALSLCSPPSRSRSDTLPLPLPLTQSCVCFVSASYLLLASAPCACNTIIPHHLTICICRYPMPP